MTLSQVNRKYLGFTEKPKNTGFHNAEFEARMKACGFQSGQAWCCYFQELCSKEAWPKFEKELSKVFNTGSVLVTLRNIEKLVASGSKLFTKCELPEIDALCFYQSYIGGAPSPTGTGHISCVSDVDTDQDQFKDISGNTDDGKDQVREGFIVAENLQVFSIASKRQKGLKLVAMYKFTPQLTA